jgi:hypothetical protein
MKCRILCIVVVESNTSYVRSVTVEFIAFLVSLITFLHLVEWCMCMNWEESFHNLFLS